MRRPSAIYRTYRTARRAYVANPTPRGRHHVMKILKQMQPQPQRASKRVTRVRVYRARRRMCWGERLDSLNDKEFVWRYKVTKERYAWLCDQLRTQLAPRWNPIIASRDPAKRHHNDALSVELKLSMTLRFMAGGGCCRHHGSSRGTVARDILLHALAYSGRS